MGWMRQESDSDTPQRFTPDPPVDVVRERKGAAIQPAAHLGKTVFIQGEVRSEEDLVVDGRIEGKLYVKKNRLTLGSSAKVKGEVHARWVVVSGEVDGDVRAGDRLEITTGGLIRGDVRAPRLVVAEGARIQGAVDTDPVQGAQPAKQEKAAVQGSQAKQENAAVQGSQAKQESAGGKVSGNGQQPAMRSGGPGK